MSEGKPRCPFRVKAMDRPDTCDERCAWALEMVSGDIEEGFTRSYRCAVAVGARALHEMDDAAAFMTVPYYEEEC